MNPQRQRTFATTTAGRPDGQGATDASASRESRSRCFPGAILSTLRILRGAGLWQKVMAWRWPQILLKLGMRLDEPRQGEFPRRHETSRRNRHRVSGHHAPGGPDRRRGALACLAMWSPVGEPTRSDPHRLGRGTPDHQGTAGRRICRFGTRLTDQLSAPERSARGECVWVGQTPSFFVVARPHAPVIFRLCLERKPEPCAP